VILNKEADRTFFSFDTQYCYYIIHTTFEVTGVYFEDTASL